MKEFFEETNFRSKSWAVINQANEIINEYQGYGMTLTLRQLYYQFVARDILPNNKRSYDNLGRVISNARLAGLIDWSAIEDRTRFLRGRRNWQSPSSMIRYHAANYSIDMWEGQEHRVEVWIEKDALLGVIEDVCRDNDVDYFACRGYVSQSELYYAGKRIKRHREQTGQDTIVIHLGDHDPSGIDMTRDNEDRLTLFSGDHTFVERIALNYDQVEQYNPPPNPAKFTDSRAEAYIEKHGFSSWELDALEPRVLQKLIQSTIDKYKDGDIWEEREKVFNYHKEQFNRVIDVATNPHYFDRAEKFYDNIGMSNSEVEELNEALHTAYGGEVNPHVKNNILSLIAKLDNFIESQDNES